MAVRKIFLITVLTLGVFAAPGTYAAGEKISDDVKYDIKDWAPDLLNLHKVGPRILSKDFPVELKAYPANSSQETADELAALKEFAANERTAEQVEKIKHENKVSPIALTFSQNGFYDFDTHPILNSLISTVDRDVSYFILDQKLKFQRARPTQLMADLTTVIPVPSHSAYPSGHAGQTYATALVLSEIDPVHAEKYKKLAIDVAHRREIAGVHYPSDSEAGRQLAMQVVGALLNDPSVQKRVAMAKKEFSASSQ